MLSHRVEETARHGAVRGKETEEPLSKALTEANRILDFNASVEAAWTCRDFPQRYS